MTFIRYNVIKMITKTFFNNDILFGFNNVLSKDKNIFVINEIQYLLETLKMNYYYLYQILSLIMIIKIF